MILVKPSATFESPFFKNSKEVYKAIEMAGRTCYKSEGKATEDSAEPFVKMILDRGHLSVLEHVSFTARFVFDRGVSHEMVRHRLAAYSQESTRFCNYERAGHVIFVAPHWLLKLCAFDESLFDVEVVRNKVFNLIQPFGSGCNRWEYEDMERVKDFLWMCLDSERYYIQQVSKGYKPEDARGGLVHFVKTELVRTANIRDWLHVFSLRTSPKAHPDMREAMNFLYAEFCEAYPTIVNGSELGKKEEMKLLISEALKQIDKCSFKDEIGNDLRNNLMADKLFKKLKTVYGVKE